MALGIQPRSASGAKNGIKAPPARHVELHPDAGVGADGQGVDRPRLTGRPFKNGIWRQRTHGHTLFQYIIFVYFISFVII